MPAKPLLLVSIALAGAHTWYLLGRRRRGESSPFEREEHLPVTVGDILINVSFLVLLIAALVREVVSGD